MRALCFTKLIKPISGMHLWIGFQFSNVNAISEVLWFYRLFIVHRMALSIEAKKKYFCVWASHVVLIFLDWKMSSTYELIGRWNTIFCRGLALIWMLFCHSTLPAIQVFFDDRQFAGWIYRPLCKYSTKSVIEPSSHLHTSYKYIPLNLHSIWFIWNRSTKRKTNFLPNTIWITGYLSLYHMFHIDDDNNNTNLEC